MLAAPTFITRLTWVWIVLAIAGLAYMFFCPAVYHQSESDFIAGLFVALGLVAAFTRRR